MAAVAATVAVIVGGLIPRAMAFNISAPRSR